MWSWHILRYYNRICLKVPRKNLSQDSNLHGRDSKCVLLEYKSTWLTFLIWEWSTSQIGMGEFPVQFSVCLFNDGSSIDVTLVHGVRESVYSTHWNEERGPSQHTSKNQCLLRYGRVWHSTGCWNNTAACTSCIFVYLSLCLSTLSWCTTDAILRKSSDIFC
jgi:hypothetical protein